MKYSIKSKYFKWFLWLFLSACTLVDLLAYVIVIIPGKVDFVAFDHTIYFLWFAGKIAALVCLFIGKGPLKASIVVAFLPLALYGFYCSLVFPLLSGKGYSYDVLMNFGIGLFASALMFASSKLISKHA